MNTTTTTVAHRLALMEAVSLGTFLLMVHAAASLIRDTSTDAGVNINDMNINNHNHSDNADNDTLALQQIRRVVETGMRCADIPGLALAVVKDGQVIMSEGFGVKDVDRPEAVTSDTKFLLASLTKAFTATLLTQVLSADPRKNVYTNVYKTVEGGLKFNNSLRSTYATLEDLLAHRTGVPRNKYLRLEKDFSIHNLARKIQYLPSKGPFRDSFYYSDIMYGLAAFITEQQQANKTWKQQMRDTIFSPLGMNNSTFVDDVDFDSDDVATPYVREDGQIVKASVDFIKHWGRNLGSGNIMSTANDLTRWMLMLLGRGRDGQGRKVVEEEVLERVFSPQNVIRSSSAPRYRRPSTPYTFAADTYGLGWRIGYYKGFRMAYHSGSSFGYRSYLTLLPDMQVGVVSMMTGSDYGYRFRIPLHLYLMDRALGHDPWITSDNICSYPHSARNKRNVDTPNDGTTTAQRGDDDDDDEGEARTQPERKQYSASCVTHNLESFSPEMYTGSYKHQAYGTLNVYYNHTAHSLVLEYGVGLWCLQTTGQHRFDGEWLKGPPTISAEFKFRTKQNTALAVEATSFEPSVVPVFFRIHQ